MSELTELEHTRHRDFHVIENAQIQYSATQHLLNIQVTCLLYTSPSPRDLSTSRMPSSA